MNRFVLAAEHVLPVTAPPLSPGWLAVEDGRIAALGAGPPPRDRGAIEDLGRAFLIPGLVNAHAHLACQFLRGVRGCDRPFSAWMSEVVLPALTAPRDEDERRALFAAAARAAAAELLAAGVTTVADSFLADAGREALEAAGLRGVFCREVFGASEPDLEAYGARVRSRLAEDRARATPRVAAGIAPHAPYTCPPELLKVCADEARRHGQLVTIHLAETLDEVAFVRDGAGPMAKRPTPEGAAPRFARARSPVALADACGLLGPRTLIVHAVHVDAADIALIAERGAAVVHCPGSNARLGVGAAPVAELAAAGVTIALGTDSGASNGKLDLFEEMRLAIALARSVRRDFAGPDAPTALRWATCDAARALGLEGEVGALTPGARADLVAVRLAPLRHGDPVEDPVGALVFSTLASDVASVWVEGRRLAGASPR